MYGYGSYGMTMPDGFPGSTDSIYRLIDRGFIFAVALIRGGSEMGREWYENAKFLKKKNTFKDFISCAEFLTRNKWTASKLAIAGGSAGGMLMGACMNMRPELFNVVVAHVPFIRCNQHDARSRFTARNSNTKEWETQKTKNTTAT